MTRQMAVALVILLYACSRRESSATRGDDTAASGSVARTKSAVATFTQRADSAEHRQYLTVGHRFLFVGERATDTSVLVRETITRTCCRQAEKSATATIALAGWVGRTDTDGAPDWTDSLEADEGEIVGFGSDALYRANLEGCCDTGSLLTFINLRSGKLRFYLSQYNGPDRGSLPEAYDWLNGAMRFVAFHDIYTSSDPPESKGDETVVGVLQYGPPDGPIQRVVVSRTNGSASDYRLEEMGFAEHDTIAPGRLGVGNNDKPHSSAEAFTGIAIIIRLKGMDAPWVSIRVPVTRDSLDVSHAVMPNGFTIGKSAEPVSSQSKVSTASFEPAAAPRVPAHPPDSLPQWVHADTNVIDGGNVIAGPIAKHIVVIAFDSASSPSQRSAAVGSIGGTVVGGVRMYDLEGFYYIGVPQAATPAQVVAAAEKANAMPGVTFAAPDMLGEAELDSSASGRRRLRARSAPQH